MTTPIDCERCGADITNDPEVDAWMCGNCVQLEEEYYADAAAQAPPERLLEVTEVAPDNIRADDVCVNQYGQIMWVALFDAEPMTVDRDDGRLERVVVVNVATLTGEQFNRTYRTRDDVRFVVRMVGSVRTLRVVRQ